MILNEKMNRLESKKFGIDWEKKKKKKFAFKKGINKYKIDLNL